MTFKSLPSPSLFLPTYPLLPLLKILNCLFSSAKKREKEVCEGVGGIVDNRTRNSNLECCLEGVVAFLTRDIWPTVSSLFIGYYYVYH